MDKNDFSSGTENTDPDDRDASNLQKQKLSQKHGLLVSQPVNDCIKEAMALPPNKMLFDELWCLNEICILFSDTNLGKSCLAIQIADSITYGKSINHLKLQVEPQPVIYLDFELSGRQFLRRYSDFDDETCTATNVYQFHKYLFRSELDPVTIYQTQFSFDSHMMQSIEDCILFRGAKILIIDNLTYLRGEIDKAKNALPLMQKLNDLKKRYDLSILVLAHTPKRDLSKPISQNDLAGSKMLLNFCDSAFAIGQSQIDTNIRYIKQIKQRNTGLKYGSENVLVFDLIKPDNFLKFNFIRLSSEREHLKVWSKADRESLNLEIMDLHKGGMSQRDIAKQLGTNHMNVKRIIDQYHGKK